MGVAGSIGCLVRRRWVSSIAQEQQRNPRLGADRTLEDFVELMANLNVPYPKFIDYAVPGNRACGICQLELPDQTAPVLPSSGSKPTGMMKRSAVHACQFILALNARIYLHGSTLSRPRRWRRAAPPGDKVEQAECVPRCATSEIMLAMLPCVRSMRSLALFWIFYDERSRSGGSFAAPKRIRAARSITRSVFAAWPGRATAARGPRIRTGAAGWLWLGVLRL